MQTRPHAAGFTIVEVVTVIAIIATLTAIIYASFSGAQARSRDGARVADLGSIALSLERYFNQYGQYPTDLSALSNVPTPPSSPSGDAYQYHYFPMTAVGQSSTICTSYQLWTTLEESSQYLSQKRGFDSTNLPAGTYDCGGTHATSTVDAASATLVYDLVPQ